MRELDPRELSGRILALPFVNPASFLQRTPFVSPQDGKNPNRSFPGDPAGTFTEALAHHVFRELIEPSDYLVDLHGGDMVEALHPFVLFDESDVGCGRAPHGDRVRLREPRPDSARRADRGDDGRRSGRCRDSRDRRGGGWARTARAGSRRPAHATASLSVLRELGMLTGEPSPARSRVLSRRFAWLYAPEAGWWRAEIAPGDEVEAGQRLGAIEDLFGDERSVVEAPEDGVVLFMTSVPAVDRGGILCGLGTRREAV